MNEQDKKISRLYKETYGNVHASEDLKGKVTDMKNKNNRKAKVIKLVCGVAAAAVALTVGTIAVSASRTKYDKIFVNGEDISNYSKKELKEFFNKQLEGEI